MTSVASSTMTSRTPLTHLLRLLLASALAALCHGDPSPVLEAGGSPALLQLLLGTWQLWVRSHTLAPPGLASTWSHAHVQRGVRVARRDVCGGGGVCGGVCGGMRGRVGVVVSRVCV